MSGRTNRRSLRLQGYDYAQTGAYFVTICTQDRNCLFGEIIDGEVRLNEAGRMIQAAWNDLPVHYPGVDIDASVIMPNHLHGIVVLVGAAPRGRPDAGEAQGGAPAGVTVYGQPRRVVPTGVTFSGQAQGPAPTGVTVSGQPRGVAPAGLAVSGQPQGVAPTDLAVSGQAQGPAPTLSLPDVVHRFKTLTSKRYIDGVKTSGWQPFRGRVWQRNYYEHIIRNEASLHAIREYIANNPLQWALDRENPVNVGAAPRGRPESAQVQGPAPTAWWDV